MKGLKFLCLGFVVILAQTIRAQDSLLNKLSESITENNKTSLVEGTFKANHIVNMQTIEAPARGNLNFEIQHRFGKLNSGAYNFFGLDNATLRLGFDYGITDRLAVGIGRSSYQKTFDGYAKYKLLQQSEGVSAMPVTISILVDITYFTQDGILQPNASGNLRTSYAAELLIARKFSRNLSLQFIPTYLHYNYVPSANDKNNQFALCMGGRMKVTKRMSIDAEYNYLLPNQMVSVQVYNSFSLGWEIETGGHVFQLIFTNSASMLETQYISNTTGRWGSGDIYFGFNIARNFVITHRAKKAIVY
jgi:opacity protein-like surface antigen